MFVIASLLFVMVNVHVQSAIAALSTSIVAVSAAQIPLFNLRPQSHTEGYKFNPLLHLPGISPYFDAIGAGLSHEAPRDCEVTAASYLVRHGAIYANDNDYEKYMEPFIKKLNSTDNGKKREGWTGPLAFFADWKNPIDDPKKQLEQLTPDGAKDAEEVGKHLLSRYPKLIPTTKKIYSDTKSRTQDTAVAFVKSFKQKIELIQVDDSHTSFHAQNPHKACKAFSKEPGDFELEQWMIKYTKPIVARLQQFSPVELEERDMMGLQQWCGYESAITGKTSKICDVFTDNEWLEYEYGWDMKYAAMVGHGNPLSPYLGFPWLNTTEQLFRQFHAPKHHAATNAAKDDDGQRFFVSFTHREVPPFIATALGLFNSSSSQAETFPLDKVNWSRAWRMAELIPFLGHVGMELLTCNFASSNPEDDQEYIRIIANSAPRPIPACSGGPGASCEFDEFSKLVKQGMHVYGDFDKVCKNKKKKDKVNPEL